MKMLPWTVKLLATLVALSCFTVVYLTAEAADTCPVTRASCLPGLPGRAGRDGQPGRDGDDGIAGPRGVTVVMVSLDHLVHSPMLSGSS